MEPGWNVCVGGEGDRGMLMDLLVGEDGVRWCVWTVLIVVGNVKGCRGIDPESWPSVSTWSDDRGNVMIFVDSTVAGRKDNTVQGDKQRNARIILQASSCRSALARDHRTFQESFATTGSCHPL